MAASLNPREPFNDPAQASDLDVAAVTPELQTQAIQPQRQLGTTPFFADFLAPLKPDTFQGAIGEVEQRLLKINQILAILELDTHDFELTLLAMLESIALKVKEIMGVDQAALFLVDAERRDLWTIATRTPTDTPTEIRIPADRGLMGTVVNRRESIMIGPDCYTDPRTVDIQEQDQAAGYRTYSVFIAPLINANNELVAVIQLSNKLDCNASVDQPLAEPPNESLSQAALAVLPPHLASQGFTTADEQTLNAFTPSIGLILATYRTCDRVIQKQRATSALMDAIHSLNQSSLDLQATLRQVMNEAKHLMRADRGTLWLVDDDTRELWTTITLPNGDERELRIPVGVGFAGQVAQTGIPINVPFDLYDHPHSGNSRKTDQETDFRTCSLLCMPIFNTYGDLIGVTQLVNKYKPGDYPAYDPNTWPAAPECWQASFNRSDMEFMQAFNIQAGVAIQNAKLFAKTKQQEQMQRDILRSLSNGVISTDREGRILAFNESAVTLLGCEHETELRGQFVRELMHLQEGDFSAYLAAALQGEREKDRQQYYPDQTLIVGDGQHNVHLAINAIAATQDPSKINGALVVMEDISGEKRLKSTMYRYMTQELAEELLKSDDTKLGGDRKDVSILFSDIRSYTTLTENMDAEDVVSLLNEYFESMVDAVFQYKGTLDKYIGDAIMAVFGSPLSLADHPWRAVLAAVEMRHRLKLFNQARAETNQKPIRIGIGISSGSVISGNIGCSKRMEFTAIGDEVNLSSRLEGASKLYGCDIIISEHTYQYCAEQIWARELDYIKVKGKTKPVFIYELLGLKEGPLAVDITTINFDLIGHYHQGRRYYLERQFAKAGQEFSKILTVNQDEKAASLQLRRCWYWLQNPPAADWDGAWEMREK
ncbi:MAG: adenylate/guanylate cyclase domain-containing protein [Cyanobacteria bacterium P01_H01_bin.121]